MSVKNVVKVMNFHSLIRVNNARKRVTEAYAYENELKIIISSIVNNRIFKEDHLSIKMSKGKKELNIYIGSDLGFCANFNADIISYLREDDPDNDKIIIGKRINIPCENVLLFMNKEDFPNEYDKIYDIVLDGVLNEKYSQLNIIYIHYNNLNSQEVMKRKILPLEIDENIKLPLMAAYPISPSRVLIAACQGIEQTPKEVRMFDKSFYSRPYFTNNNKDLIIHVRKIYEHDIKTLNNSIMAHTKQGVVVLDKNRFFVHIRDYLKQ